jgi:hypothetical protein
MITTYTDAVGSVATQIQNFPSEDGNSYLLMEIEGVLFRGNSFDDFEVLDYDTYSTEQLERFTFNKHLAYQSKATIYDLCNCKLEVKIPIVIIKKSTQEELESVLNLSLELGSPSANGGIDHESAIFSLHLEQEYFQQEGDVFEVGLDGLKKAIGANYHFKNCYGCLYADYSPYGLGFFNSLMCFKQQKEAYIALSANFSKSDYFKVIDKGFGLVQETYTCPSFEIRLPKTGYRG